jgi:hypothetical protein
VTLDGVRIEPPNLPTDAPRPVIFEAFRHYSLPGSSNMACTVIQALGDRKG